MRLRKKISRRSFLHLAAAFGFMAGVPRRLQAFELPGFCADASINMETCSEEEQTVVNLRVSRRTVEFDGRKGSAIMVNDSIPAPLLRFRQGEEVVINVTNDLDEDTSIHWHGILLPPNMDGVPGVSFAGIKARETFTYRFPIKQYGTYWYHSHSAMQEQLGMYGPLILDPLEPEPFTYSREYVVMLSDWTFDNPDNIIPNLKKEAGYYNYQKRTVGDFFRDIRKDGMAAWRERLMWGKMIMDPTDLLDLTGAGYTFLLNGMTSSSNWTGLFVPGERLRLRFINGSSASFFDVRIPGLPMTVVLADGQYVQPVETDEIRIAIAETYDVIIEPKENRAYTLFAEAMDRSGLVRGTLAPREGMVAPLPQRRKRALRTMSDMGMAGMLHGGAGMSHDMSPHGTVSHDSMAHGADHGLATGKDVYVHGPDHHGPGNSMIAEVARSRLHDRGTGLEDAPWRVLVYGDLKSLEPGTDPRQPTREIELHLTGNMEKFIWSINGKKYSDDPAPIRFSYGERLRVVFINDTMMDHPMHLHGMWMELDNGNGIHNPRKHTISVKPAERLSFIVTADAPGNWAFHCHILYHMEAGMFRVVHVSAAPEGGTP